MGRSVCDRARGRDAMTTSAAVAFAFFPNATGIDLASALTFPDALAAGRSRAPPANRCCWCHRPACCPADHRLPVNARGDYLSCACFRRHERAGCQRPDCSRRHAALVATNSLYGRRRRGEACYSSRAGLQSWRGGGG